ncbi:MAG: RnfABCDGE type electron transport complex subunit D [Cellulosilyticaceae bacterium]
MEKQWNGSSSPHVRADHSIQSIMKDVIIALMPALVVGIYFFGIRALVVTLVCVISCVGFETLWQKCTRQCLTLTDLSAVVTGILLAFNLSADTPLYIPVVGAFVAIILAKQFFGGLGQNFINPALAARAFLLAAYPTGMTTFVQNVDIVTGATPLALMKQGEWERMPSMMQALVGQMGGCIGEVSAVALLLGGIYLIYKKIITWHIPVCYLGTLFVVSVVFGGCSIYQSFYSLLLGGAMLGAFFMATDYTTTPMTIRGQVIFAVGAGLIAAVIRLFGGYPEGVSYSILLMNLVVPLIDRYVKPRTFGEVESA